MNGTEVVPGDPAGASARASASGSESTPAAGTPPILVVMGVSGSGKSTLATRLATALGWDLAEGDDLHPQANIDKMALGHPLTDADRAPWLDLIAAWIAEHTAAGRPGIVACSALKRRYRDRLRAPGVIFVHPHGPRATVHERMHRRRDHFMPESLLDSQYADLEQLAADESGIVVDLALSPDAQAAEVLARLGLAAAGHSAPDEPAPAPTASSSSFSARKE
ncbi:gluconokinase [Brevibacterium sp. 91QC2O2]|uniref:gluconokinase n=1 Tax=Brevibacterium sp. 91QC2O2 TaxID=2968458 RepID=UPI00211BB50E|nr:gluconokinase [Brevibacterium sp. 91QC2O2]